MDDIAEQHNQGAAEETRAKDAGADTGSQQKPIELELPPLPKKPVKVTVSAPADGVKPACETLVELELHTPTILREVEKTAEGCTVKIEIAQYQTDKGEAERKPGEKPEVTVGWRKAFDGPRDEAIKQLKSSIIAAEDVPKAIHRYLKYVFDNSDLKLCSVSVVVATPDGQDATAAFVVPGNHCTNAQAVELVNVMDANANEFVAKAKLEIPGRNAPKMGGLILPTEADKEKLGIK